MNVSTLRVHLLAAGGVLALGMIVAPAPAEAQVSLGDIVTGIDEHLVCYTGTNQLVVSDSEEECGNGIGDADPTGIFVGPTGNDVILNADGSTAVFNTSVNFNDTTQFSGTAAFSGNTGFNGATSFSGPSTTFITGATFQAAITTSGITNTGNIFTGGLSVSGNAVINALGAGDLVVVNELSVLPGAAIDMGDNIVGGVAAGEVSATSTEAVNGSQLFATNQQVAANTTAITALQTGQGGQAGQIAALQAGQAAQAMQIAVQGDQIQTLFDLADINRRDIRRANEGVAMALAMESPHLPPGATFAVSGGVGYFQNRTAGTFAFTMRAGPTTAVSAGVGFGFNSGEVGARAGFQHAW